MRIKLVFFFYNNELKSFHFVLPRTINQFDIPTLSVIHYLYIFLGSILMSCIIQCFIIGLDGVVSKAGDELSKVIGRDRVEKVMSFFLLKRLGIL